MIISCWILLRMRKFSDKLCRQNQNTRFMFNISFRKSCRLWDNLEKYGTARQDTDDNIIRRMRFACWITKATDTHSKCAIVIAFPWQQWLRKCASILRLYGHCLFIMDGEHVGRGFLSLILTAAYVCASGELSQPVADSVLYCHWCSQGFSITAGHYIRALGSNNASRHTRILYKSYTG
jgi:hypothetical protein